MSRRPRLFRGARARVPAALDARPAYVAAEPPPHAAVRPLPAAVRPLHAAVGPRLGGARPLRAAWLAAALAGCTEDALTSLPPEGAPGTSGGTVEVSLRASDFPEWDDTTYTGFVLPSGASFVLAAEEPGFRSRILGRFGNLPDSVLVDTVRRAVVSFDSARFRLLVDTLRSVFPQEGASQTLAVHSLTRDFAARDASWTEAAAGVPWGVAGGDLGLVLGSLEVAEGNDTLFVPLQGVDADSLLTAWRETGGQPGFALLLADGTGRLGPTNIALELRVRLEGVDTLITQLRSASPATFIFDPPPPPPAFALRIGGVPSSRGYVRFVPPERAGGVPLRGSTINRAEVVLEALDALPAPFALSRASTASAIRLLADPFVLGEKTPIGASLGLAALDPDSLATGDSVVFDVTAIMREWAGAAPDSITELHLGFRAVPEGGELGAWEFASSQAARTQQPLLRLLVTPPTDFQIP